MREINRRKLATLALSSGLAVASLKNSFAQGGYPERYIRVIIGFPAGSGADTVARFFASQISKLAGQPLVVENKPGAFSSIAFLTVGSAKPDGYTVLWTGSSIMAGGKHMVKNLAFDADKDFVPVAAFAEFPFVLVVSGKSKVTNLQELVQEIRSKPRALYGHFNPPAYLTTAVLMSRLGVKAEPVPYRGAGAAVPELNNGTLDFMILDAAFAVGLIQSGMLRALAVTSAERVPSLPDVPTMTEAGLSDLQATPWWGAWFPVGTPQPIVDKFHSWFVQVAKDPKTAEFLNKIAVLPVAVDASGVRERLRVDAAMWDRWSGEIGLTPN